MSASMAQSAAPSISALDRVRQLQMPSREETLRRAAQVYEFWNENEAQLEQAWEEWQSTDDTAAALPQLSPATLLNPRLRQAVEAAWKEPSAENEAAIKGLWEEVAPGVYAIQFMNLDKVDQLREWFDAAAASGIPTRPPYGITLNRKGFMTDPRSVGYLAAPGFQSFYRELVDTYVRPLGRLFFPQHIREPDDAQSFSFSIQYQGQAGGDKSIRPHADSSTVTFNINLDREKTWTGSSLTFFHQHEQYPVEWKPGYAVMHHGRTLHAAEPIGSGTRSNLVVWTFAGDGGRGGSGPGSELMANGTYPEAYQLTPKERWSKLVAAPVQPLDRWSPF